MVLKLLFKVLRILLSMYLIDLIIKSLTKEIWSMKLRKPTLITYFNKNSSHKLSKSYWRWNTSILLPNIHTRFCILCWRMTLIRKLWLYAKKLRILWHKKRKWSWPEDLLILNTCYCLWFLRMPVEGLTGTWLRIASKILRTNWKFLSNSMHLYWENCTRPCYRLTFHMRFCCGWATCCQGWTI